MNNMSDNYCCYCCETVIERVHLVRKCDKCAKMVHVACNGKKNFSMLNSITNQFLIYFYLIYREHVNYKFNKSQQNTN